MASRRVRTWVVLGLAPLMLAQLVYPGLARAGGPVSVSSLPVVSCGEHSTSVLPASTTVTDDGWTVLEYEIGGVVNRQYVPPMDFNPSSMSNEDIQRHHLPARPDAASEQQEWASNVRSLAGPHTRNLCVGSRDGVKMGSQRYSSNWGGDEVRYQTAYRFDGVQGHFTQAAMGTGCGNNSALSEWVGIGGDDTAHNDYPFFQAGTSAQGPVLDTPGYYSFYEYFAVDIIPDPNPVYMYDYTVAPGDAMYAEVDWSASSSMAFFYVGNLTRQWAWMTSVSDPLLWTGLSAEWIDERPVAGARPLTLTNYSTPGYPNWTSWTQLKTHHTNSTPATWTPAYSEPTEWWIMITSNGQPYHSGSNRKLSQTTGTYSDSHMKDHWYACQ